MHYLEASKELHLLSAGIALESICLDPGIGFGKTHSHNIELMKHASKFLDLKCPILIGHSRKGFLGKLVKQDTPQRSIVYSNVISQRLQQPAV